jgi:hypothetical protein
MVLYAEMGMDTLNWAHHVLAMCYLLHAFKLASRSLGQWSTLEYISKRYRKNIFISEDLPTTMGAMQTRM